MLELGSQNNVFKTGTKWLCDIYSIIKTLTSGGKNVERNYHNLIHKQSIWMAICLWNGTFVGAKRNRSQFSYQNATFLIKFLCWWKVFLSPNNLKFCLKYVLRHSVKKNANISRKKIPCYFAQSGIFADISGYRQLQISLLIYLLFSVGKLQTQE